MPKQKQTPEGELDFPDGIVVVRPSQETMTKQKLPNFVGVSGTTAGSHAISMNLVVIPPGSAAIPHFHKGYETAVYMMKGRVETRYGRNLEHSMITEEGDFIYIPADLPHQPINHSETEPAYAIVARNDANEQESVEEYFTDT